MKLLELYNVTKWPKSLPLYRIQIGDNFRSQWINYIGFSKHINTKEKYHNSEHIVLPIKKRKK